MARELNPRNAQTRLRRRLNPERIERDVNQIKPVKDWDWEELQRGYPRGPSGKFGKRPLWADTFRVDDEVKRRLREVTAGELRSHVGSALRVLVGLMEDEGVDLDGKMVVSPTVRLKAAEIVLEHTIGKPQASIAIEPGASFKDMLADCMVNDDDQDAHPIVIPGQVEEDEDEL